jgi:hypothetical protein
VSCPYSGTSLSRTFQTPTLRPPEVAPWLLEVAPAVLDVAEPVLVAPAVCCWTRILFWTCLTPETRSAKSSACRLASRLSTVPESVTSQDDTVTSISEASTWGSSPWRPLEVLIEAEKAAASSRYKTIAAHPDTEVVRALQA